MTKSTPPVRRKSAGEAAKRDYKHPVPDTGLIIGQLERQGVPVTIAELTALFGLRSPQHIRALRRRIDELAAAGRLLVNRRGEVCLLDKIDAVTGIVSAHRDGYGFLIPEDGSADVYLPQTEMRQLLDGDRVAVRVGGQGPRGRRAGAVVEILARGRTSIVGRYRREHGIGYVVELGRSPHHFVIPDQYRGDANEGQLVTVEIISYPSDQREAQGKVVRLLGNPEDDPEVATDAAIEIFGLPVQWSAAVRRAAAAWGHDVRLADARHRGDLRDVPLVTIDGADARDFDDAVFAEPDGDGWRVLVAIADVSHYVTPGDPLDEEAQRRATSVYFPDRVVPMLPETLSNGLCSLKPRVDRLCMVCDMKVSARGEVTRSRFYRAVMRSSARLTYAEVQAAQDGETGARRRLAEVMPQIAELYAVYRALADARSHRGALDLDLPEVKIELGDDGRVEKIAVLARNDAQRVIEECMIAANVEAAALLQRRHLPTLYRVHAAPDPEKFDDLRLMLQTLGVKVTSQAQSRPRDLNRVLRALAGRPDYPMLATAVLRTMSQAVYQPVNLGHFGLALPVYAHFTSPIRRYPDLLVHRGLGHVIDGAKPGAFSYDMPALETLGKLCSERERRADEAARHVEARYKCAYMKAQIGATLDGVVTGVTHFGLFVLIREFNVDGLVHVSGLRNDYYHLEQGGMRLSGERTGTSFGLGDAVRVRVDRVNVDEAKIDLSLTDESLPRAATRQQNSRSRRR